MARRPTKKTAKVAAKKAVKKGKTKVPAKAGKPVKTAKKAGAAKAPKAKVKAAPKAAKPAKGRPVSKAAPAKAPVVKVAPKAAPKSRAKAEMGAALAKTPQKAAPLPAAKPPKAAPALKVVKNAAAGGKPAAAPSAHKPGPMPQVGAEAPVFTLQATDGSTVALKSFRGQKNVVLYFYPKDDTPGCTVQACKFRDDLRDYQALDAVVLGVSADDLKSHGRFTAKFKLNFPLLADATTTTSQAYGVWVEKNMYGNKKLGIQRATFLIGKDGKVAHVWPKVSVEGHSDEVLAELRKLNVNAQSAGDDADDNAVDDDGDDEDDETPVRGGKKGPKSEADDDDEDRPRKRRAEADEEEYDPPTGPGGGYGDDDD